MSNGAAIRGPWNQDESTQMGEEWQYIEDPIRKVIESNGLLDCEPEGTARTMKGADEVNFGLSRERSEEIKMAAPVGPQQWNDKYPEDGTAKSKEDSSAKSKKN